MAFQKPGRCGVGMCVEVELNFQKPKMCGIGACVEVATNGPTIAIRDSKQGANGTILCFDKAEWGAFITAAKDGQYDI